MTALVLRFSNFETDTIEEHRMILRDNGRVWWAWWKKLHEPFPADELEKTTHELRAKGRLPIGLVDRATAKFFIADCVDVKFEPSGALLPSPVPELTPEYYSDRRFQTWFCFDSISQVEVGEWEPRFGPVPVGDETLFYGEDKGGIDDPACYRTDGVGILHISDLHFGDDFGYPQGKSMSITTQSRLEDVLKIGVPTKPAAIVISGDITTKGDNAGFMNAREFVKALLEKFELSPKNLVIVPGNHDILVDSPEATRDYSNEQQYRDFLNLVYSDDGLDLERIQWIKDANGVNYVFSLVNSSRPRNPKNMDYGYVGLDRSQPLLETAHNLRKTLVGQQVVSALVLHHHVLPAAMVEEPERDRPISLSLDAGELVSLCHKYEVDVVLHGHQHLPFVGYTGRVIECGGFADAPHLPGAPLWVLASGSTGAKGNRLGDEMRYNSFSRYLPDGKALDVEIYQFSPKLPPKLIWEKVKLPLGSMW
jgi:3',5'-cyclic AMP phosphodiesterase CpdA